MLSVVDQSENGPSPYTEPHGYPLSVTRHLVPTLHCSAGGIGVSAAAAEGQRCSARLPPATAAADMVKGSWVLLSHAVNAAGSHRVLDEEGAGGTEPVFRRRVSKGNGMHCFFLGGGYVWETLCS